MKRRLAFALVGLAISFASPTLAQENDTVDPGTRQELEAVDTKLDQAIDKNDAVAAAALFTEDAILMLPLAFAPERSDIFSGRPAIEKWYTQKFTEYHVRASVFLSPRADEARVPPKQQTGLGECRLSGGAFDHELIQHPWLSTPLLADLL